MAVLAQSSCVFTTLQESLRIQKDCILGIMDKDWSTTLKFVPPCRNELLRSKTAHFYARKRHTLMVSFVAARLGSSVAETSRPWLLQDREKIKTTLVCVSSRLKTSERSFRILGLARLCYAYLKNHNHTQTLKETCLQVFLYLK